jgi:HEAT repeat protein
MRFFCPRCWHDFERDEARCPHCGLDIEEFWNSKDYVEKLIAALHHPEKETPIRAAWLLGQLKDPRAVPPLIELVKETEDVYIARAAVQALGEIDTPQADRFLRNLTQHHVKMVRDEVQKILAEKESSHRTSKERISHES